MDGISDHLTYTIYCVYAISMYVIEKAIINSSEVIYDSIYVSKSINRQFYIFFKWKKSTLWVHFRDIACSHAMETDSFLEYALPSHSWSDGNGSCRNLQRRAPYFSSTIIMQTTKRVKQAVAGQKTCKPIIRNFLLPRVIYLQLVLVQLLKQLAEQVAMVSQSIFFLLYKWSRKKIKMILNIRKSRAICLWKQCWWWVSAYVQVRGQIPQYN